MTRLQRERDAFTRAMSAEGVPEHVSALIMRHATTIQRLAVVACNDEWADRDRVRCPRDSDPCLCQNNGDYRHDTGTHGTIPRYMLKDRQAERRITTLLAPYHVVPVFGGDPRGACVKLRVPSGRTDDWGQTGLCVPTRDF